MLELIILDLNQDGVNITNDRTVYAYDVKNGRKSLIQWIGPDDAILYIDGDKSGTANLVKEYDFKTKMKPNVPLLNIFNMFDSNDDQVIDSKDVFYSKLRVWIDYNQNGISETDENKLLSDLGLDIYVDKRYYNNDSTFKFRLKSAENNKNSNYILTGYSVKINLLK